jgi:excisionase family DNA binding protein
MLSVVIPESTWASTLPAEQIPAALTKLAALQTILASRLLGEQVAPLREAQAEPLLDAKEMAGLLKCHESWVRSAARQGKIPFVAVGRYMRFRPRDVQAVIASARNL